ncbi:MAG: response regulator [Sphingobacteriales bacterium]|nr:MAG: response regulator [Sphingobacteriales bacterium]
MDILPESNPSPDENFFLAYKHPYSFEADSWNRAGKAANTAVCIMNAGYSSGWCEESFNIPLTAVEVSCTAKGDDSCVFIMSPPHKIQEHLEKFHTGKHYKQAEAYEVPTFFDRKRVEEEMQRSRLLAEESAKSKSDFIANISHELRTPLGAILGFTDMLKKTTLNPVQLEYLEAVNSSGNNLLAIINDILDLSKIDAGKFIIESLPFSIHELLHSVRVMFETKARQKGIEFTCGIDEKIDAVVEGDPMRLTQVLMNLIGNAIKFTEKGGVYVNCELLKSEADFIEVMFRITDTGIGIDADKTATIFERFTQADNNITRKYGGTGLGLAITKQLIELQGGHIDVKSTKGHGTVFCFTISYKKTTEEINFSSQIIDNGSSFFETVKRLLVVEDNLMNQKLATLILEANGLEVSVAANGTDAIAVLKQESFDVILMDIQMPVMDGYEATRILRNDLGISTPVIAMTAHALAGEKEKCISAGMNDYISKPYKEAELLAKIRQLNFVETGTPPTKATGIIDFSFLKKQTKNNKKFIAEMVAIFIQQHPKDLTALKNAIETKDFLSIYKITHTIRNSIVFFGLEQKIEEPLMQMEKLARDENAAEQIEILYKQVEPVGMAAVAELKDFDMTLLD